MTRTGSKHGPSPFSSLYSHTTALDSAPSALPKAVAWALFDVETLTTPSDGKPKVIESETIMHESSLLWLNQHRLANCI